MCGRAAIPPPPVKTARALARAAADRPLPAGWPNFDLRLVAAAAAAVPPFSVAVFSVVVAVVVVPSSVCLFGRSLVRRVVPAAPRLLFGRSAAAAAALGAISRDVLIGPGLPVY